MPNRLGPGDKTPQRLRVPEGMQIKWVPKGTSKSSDEAAKGQAAAQLHQQAMRLSEGRPAAEPGEAYVSTAQPTAEDRKLMQLNRAEQGPRFASPEASEE